MKKLLLIALLLTGCDQHDNETERLQRIDAMDTNELRNALRVCALNASQWSDCYIAIMLFKSEAAK